MYPLPISVSSAVSNPKTNATLLGAQLRSCRVGVMNVWGLRDVTAYCEAAKRTPNHELEASAPHFSSFTSHSIPQPDHSLAKSF